LKGTAIPETPVDLMRSRYTAFAVGDIDYVLATHDPDTVGQVDRRNTEAWS
jgi:SEC-C motif-containing protein